MWCSSEPQQPSPAGATSTPARASSRAVAALISGANTAWAQPVSSATRRRRPTNDVASIGAAAAAAGARRFAASASIAASCGPTRGSAAISGANGRANPPSLRPAANQARDGNSRANAARISRSASGRR